MYPTAGQTEGNINDAPTVVDSATAKTTLPWVYDDGGRYAAGYRPYDVGDCVTRSIAIGTGLPYSTVVDMVNAMGRERGRRMYQDQPGEAAH